MAELCNFIIAHLQSRCKHHPSGSSGPVQDLQGMLSFKELSCRCWENVVLCGWAGIPASGGELIHVWDADTQCRVEGRQEAKGQRSFMFRFFQSCHKAWILLHKSIGGGGKDGLMWTEICRLTHRWQTVLVVLVQFSSVQSLSLVQLFATPWIAACQASLSITNSRSSHNPMSILCRSLFLLT